MDADDRKLLTEIHSNTTVLSRLFEAHVENQEIHKLPVHACPLSRENKIEIRGHVDNHPSIVKNDISLLVGGAVLASLLGGGGIVYLIVQLAGAS